MKIMKKRGLRYRRYVGFGPIGSYFNVITVL